jgi:ABC-2 type transport system permease protein
MTQGLDAMRQIMFTMERHLEFLSVPTGIGILAGLTVLYFSTGTWLLNHIEQRARKEGRLTLRWQ